MHDFEDLVDRYIAIWNETDAERRRELIARTWSGDATYVDPLLEGEGHAGIDRVVAAVHERYPGHRFRRVGAADGHHDRFRFGWEFAPQGSDPIVVGTDFAVLGADRKLATVTGFFDRVATPAG